MTIAEQFVVTLFKKLQTLHKDEVLQVARFLGVMPKDPSKIMEDVDFVVVMAGKIEKLSSDQAIELGKLMKMDANLIKLVEMASNFHNN
jgi:hemerythrin superfamily protein